MFTLFVELVIPLDEHVLGFISIRSLNLSYRTSMNEEVPIPTDWLDFNCKLKYKC